MKILVADDEKEVALSLKGALVKKGHDVDIAFDGKRALELVKLNSHELVFLDHNMPGLTGMEIIKYIKENKPNVKTVMITGYEDMDDSFAKLIGADEYIEKPLNIEDIIELVNRYSKKE